MIVTPWQLFISIDFLYFPWILNDKTCLAGVEKYFFTNPGPSENMVE